MARRARVVTALLTALLLLPAAALGADDPYRSQQWALDDIRAEEAWDVSRGGDAIVAVVDTGVDLEHPDLRDRILRDADGEVLGLDLVGDGLRDRHGHGTLVAGVIAATAGNGEGVVGVAPRARIMPVRVLDEAGGGRARDVGEAIRWAVDHGAHVVNLSLESLRDGEGRSTGPGVPRAAVEYAWRRGVVVVVAAGNGGEGVSAYPDDTRALVVGASDREGRVASFSDSGGEGGVLAPGLGIVSTWCRSGDDAQCGEGVHTYGRAEGTSFAAPHVAGVAALLASEGHRAPEIVRRIRATAARSGDGPGRVDAAAALGADGTALTTAEDEGADEDRQAAGSAGDEEPGEPTAAPDPSSDGEDAPERAEPVEVPDDAAADTDGADGTGTGAEADGEGRDGGATGGADPEATAAEDAGQPSPDGGEDDATPESAPSSQPVALPDDEGAPGSDVWLTLLAAALVGASLAAWSAAARRSG